MSDEKYVVMAVFDDATSQKLSSLRKYLYESGYTTSLSEWPPHITIAAYENVELDALLRWTDKFSKRFQPFDISFASLGVFPPGGENIETAVLFAIPSQSKNFIDFYYMFHEELDEYCGKLGWFYSAKFGYPAIHSTIAVVDVAKIQKAMEAIFVSELPCGAKIIAMEVYTYPMKLIKRFELN